MKKNKKKNNGVRIFLKILLVVLIIMVIFFSTALWFVYNKLSKINYVKLENIEINEGVAEQLKGYRNIVLFGVDARGNTYTNSRSDIIMIVSLNQDTNDVKITSVYRDTYMYIEGHGYDKVTHAYAYGGPQLAINTLNKNMDLNITEFVTVNFNAVIDIIDAIGGIEIDVDAEEMGYMNESIRVINNDLHRNDALLRKTGYVKLTGAQALAYSRVRYTAGGDFKRTERSREVLNATFSKAKTMNVAKLNNLADILLPKVYTNIPATEIIGMIPSIYKINMEQGEGWPYKNAFYNNGLSYVAPVTLEENVKQMHEKMFANEEYEVSKKVKEYSNAIIKRTGYK